MRRGLRRRPPRCRSLDRFRIDSAGRDAAFPARAWRGSTGWEAPCPPASRPGSPSRCCASAHSARLHPPTRSSVTPTSLRPRSSSSRWRPAISTRTCGGSASRSTPWRAHGASSRSAGPNCVRASPRTPPGARPKPPRAASAHGARPRAGGRSYPSGRRRRMRTSSSRRPRACPPPPPPPPPPHRHLGDRMRDRPPRHRGAPRLAARLPGDGDPAPAPLRGATRPIRRGTLGGGSRQNRTLGDPGTRPSLNGDGARRTDALPGGSAAELRGS